MLLPDPFYQMFQIFLNSFHSLIFSVEAFVTINRMQEFLLSPESKQLSNKNQIIDESIHYTKSDVLPDNTDGITAIAYTSTLNENIDKRIHNINSPIKFIQLENATAIWEPNENHQTNGIFDMNLRIERGLCAIVGPVGSSKSTLLNVILGELALDAGTLTINGSISYASQETWLFAGSIRNNIIFVEEFDEQRYNKVVKVCALERDFVLLPQGDATIVGEMGSTLSGGQKARISLARAIYKNSDIYLLDDPFAAVDPHVGKHIFKQCVERFLADKICLLVTHQLQYLKNVDHVILLKNGRIQAENPFRTLEIFSRDELLAFNQSGSAVDGADDCFTNRVCFYACQLFAII